MYDNNKFKKGDKVRIKISLKTKIAACIDNIKAGYGFWWPRSTGVIGFWLPDYVAWELEDGSLVIEELLEKL